MIFLLTVTLLISMESFRMSVEWLFMELSILLSDHGMAFVSSLFGLFLFSMFSYLLEGKQQTKRNPNEPKWELFRGTNYAFILLFVFSLTYFLIHFKHLNHEVNPSSRPLVYFSGCCWGISLAYFFAFFGVSFVSDDARNLEEEEKKNTFLFTWKSTNFSPIHSIWSRSKISSSSSSLKETLNQDPSTTSHSINPAPSSTLPLTYTSSNETILKALKQKQIGLHQLESICQSDFQRAIQLRRQYFQQYEQLEFQTIPYENYDYEQIYGRNCEIVIGYVPLPLGLAGPLLINQRKTWIPMATTEGCLIASTNRGCKAITLSGGCTSLVLKDGITRAPCIQCSTALEAAHVRTYCEKETTFSQFQKVFAQTTQYGNLEEIRVYQAGRTLYLRFRCTSGDAMGMNMISKGCLAMLSFLKQQFEDIDILALSGNLCMDKKPSAINWLEGRGKSVVVETTISKKVVENVLKTTVDRIVQVTKEKCLVGSAMAGSIGGFNAHAANIVTALFLATGQDPAQNVESSNCMTLAEKTSENDLYFSITMPSIEVGTIGGGTQLSTQANCLQLLNGPNVVGEILKPGDQSRSLAKMIGGAVLAGELSLLAALSAGDLVKSHMKHNRKQSSK